MAAKRGSYSEETLKEAVRLVQDEGYSYREVLKLTGIPRTTIHKYAKSTVVIKKKHGPDTILTNDEELCLVEWATKLVRIGFPATDENLLDQVEEEKTMLRLNRIEEKKEKERLPKVKKDMKRKEAIEKRIKRRQDMNKNKKTI